MKTFKSNKLCLALLAGAVLSIPAFATELYWCGGNANWSTESSCWTNSAGVATGLAEEEERTHFGLWCMLASPLLIGCDARDVPPGTLALVTNPYLVAMNQNNGLGLQGQVAKREGEAYILVKDAFERYGKSRFVALCNLGDEAASVTLEARDLDLGGTIQAFDLVDRADIGEFEGEVAIRLPPHGANFPCADRRGRACGAIRTRRR